jgi:hypothetical protein
MKYLWILLLPLLVSCGRNGDHVSQPNDGSPHIPVTVDPALSYYMFKFQNDIGVNTSGITAQFAALSAPTVGQCVQYSNGDKVIQIDPVYWATALYSTREQLMYHEIAHCAMNLQHILTIDTNNCPISIMYPNAFGFLGCYINNEAYYYAELASHR